MQRNYKYQLDKSSKKYSCPDCHQKRFVLYLDTDTKAPLADYVGRCDREDSCQYHYTPKQYFQENPMFRPEGSLEHLAPPPPPRELGYIDSKYLRASMQHYEINPFVIWLQSLFESDMVQGLIEQFNIGTSKKHGGSVVFWQVDTDMQLRQAKVMHYDKLTGKRNKETGAYFFGKALLKKQGIIEPNLKQCLYGLHQLNTDDGRAIAIVESEKTAILMTAFAWLGIAPFYSWLATGGKYGCRWNDPETWKDLQDRKVVLFPDLGAYDDWTKKSYLIKSNVFYSDMLRKSATDEQQDAGLDVADYFLHYYLNEYKEQSKELVSTIDKTSESINNTAIEIDMTLTPEGYPVFWDMDISKKQTESIINGTLKLSA